MKKIIAIFGVGILVFFLMLNYFRNETYTKTYHLSYFYIDTCASCQAFEQEVLPTIEEEFGNHMEITKYDLDAIETKKIYDETLDKIVGFNENDYGNGPFIVLDGYFAIMGFTSEYSEYYLKDMILAIENKPLSNTLSNSRYVFKTSK